MKVTLKYPHKHAGVQYSAGASIDVPVHDALWLKGEDLIEEGLDALKAELKKLASRDNPNPYAELLAKATAADAAPKADAAATATPAAAEETAK